MSVETLNMASHEDGLRGDEKANGR